MCDVGAARRRLAAARPDPGRARGWTGPLLRGPEHAGSRDISANDLPADHVGPRQSAVLVLLGQGPGGPEVMLQRRARRLRHHSGEISFPGGRADPGDTDPAATALREATEETGPDPSGVDVVAMLPRLILLTGFHVTAVLGDDVVGVHRRRRRRGAAPGRMGAAVAARPGAGVGVVVTAARA